MAGIEDPVEIALSIYPFKEVRNMIVPTAELKNMLKIGEDAVAEVSATGFGIKQSDIDNLKSKVTRWP